jgi:NIMA (never in mitosis gene a)-related kinase
MYNVGSNTICGTPYYMVPELNECEGEGATYDEKVDIWRLRCVVYEMYTLQKAFDGENIKELREHIRNNKFKELPTDCDLELKELIECTLIKDRNKRPTVWELARIPAINKRIKQFIKDKEIDELITHCLNKGSTNKSFRFNAIGNKERVKDEGDKVIESVFEVRNRIEIRSIKDTCFRTYKKCFKELILQRQ